MNDPELDEKALFNAARRIADAAARDEFLKVACVGNAALRERITDLLGAWDDSNSFLESPISATLRGVTETPIAESIGTVIGPYKLLQQIGEGGMGTVYLAEQTHPVHRKVALKVIKPGMDSKQIIARFDAERQALAVMDHVNIARVLDAGATETGRPYFVMELVHGVPITKYCDDYRLTPRERLELFVPVCQAIQHAHQKGIIHRDIKPSNVMVTLYDGKPVPKVIDFGVAKAIEQRLTERTLFTQYGTMVGTLEYMSPEQAELSALGVDTRSDIYSLGVLLYELLTGTTPLSGQRIREAGYFEILRIIREVEPERPSTRLSESRESLASISAQRQMEPAKLTKLVRGELDWIVMKSLEKDRNRRYETANGLAAEILRYLNDEPVLACPPSTTYRLTKFARKNKKLLATLTALATLLVIATISAVVAAIQSDRLAQAAEERAESEAKARTELDLRLYANRIALAQQELYAQNIGRAEELLEECPVPLRGWEWHFLKRFRPGNPVSIPRERSGVIFSPDGQSLVGITGTVARIIDPTAGNSIRTFQGVTTWCDYYGLACCRHAGETILAAGDSRAATVKLWNFATGEELKTLEAHGDRVRSVVFSPNGKQLAAGSISSGAKIWDWKRGVVLFDVPELSISRLAYSPDGERLAIAAFEMSDNVRIFDALSGKLLRSFRSHHGSGIEGLSYSPDAQRLATSGDDGTVKIWDERTGELLRTLRGHVGPVKDVSYSTDGRRLASAGWDKTVKIWDAETGQELLTLRGHTEIVMKVTFSPSGDTLVTSGYEGIKAWHTDSFDEGRDGVVVDAPGHTDVVKSVVYSPDGKHLASAAADRLIQLWDATSLRQGLKVLYQTYEGDTDVDMSVTFSPDSQRFASAGWGGDLRVWETGRTQPVLTVKLRTSQAADDVRDLKFSPDGRKLASIGPGGMSIWDSYSGELLKTLLIPSGNLMRLAYSPDGKQLAVCHHLAVMLVDAESGTELRSISHAAPVWSLAYSTDGTRLVSACFDNSLRIWDTSTWQLLHTLSGHTDRAMCVAFSPDGTQVASGSGDSSVKLWDCNQGLELVTLRGHSGYVWSLAFSPDGKQLTSAGGHHGKGEVRVWDLAKVLPAADRPETIEKVRRQAIEFYEHLATAQPRVWQHRRHLGRSCAESGQWDRAIIEYANAIELNPTWFHEALSLLQAQGRQSEAAQIADRLVSTSGGSATEARSDWTLREVLARHFSTLGWTHLGAQKAEEARKAFQQCVEINERLIADFPGRRNNALALANNHNDLGTTLNKLGHANEAEQSYRRALAIKDALVAEAPSNPEYRFHLAHTHLGLGYLKRDLRRPEEAATSFHQAASLFENLAAELPAYPNHRSDAARALWNLSEAYLRAGKQDDAEAALQRALDTFERLAKDFPSPPQYRLEIGASHSKLGEFFRGLGRHVDAEPHLREAIQIYGKLSSESPQNAEYRRRTTQSYRELIEFLQSLNKETEAAELKAALEREYPEK